MTPAKPDAAADEKENAMPDGTAKVKCWKLSVEQGSGYLMTAEDALNGILCEVQAGEVGDKFTIEVVEVTREFYEGLGEFDGF